MQDTERLDLSSASSFAIDAACSGRQNLLRIIPPEPPKPDLATMTEEEKTSDQLQAERGTRLHKAWETGTITDLDADELEDYEIGRQFKERAIEQWLSDSRIEASVEFREQRLWMHDPKTLAPVLSGEMDLYNIGQTFAIILDFKSGWNSTLTSSERNWQLRVYAVLLGIEYPDLQNIRVGFVKPKDSFKAGPDFTDYTREDLTHAERDIRFHLWKTKQPDAQRVPGTHCRWCRAKNGFCKEAAAMSLLPSISSLNAPIDINGTKEAIATMVSLMTPEDLRAVHSRASIIGKILEEVKARLKTFTAEDLGTLGFGFGKPRTTRKIDKTKECFDYLKDTIGVSEAELWQALTFGNTKLVDALRRDQGWAKAKTDGFVKQQAETFGTVTECEAPIVTL